MNLTKVETQKQAEKVAALASKIWNQHFVPIIGQAQVDYMLDSFQSIPAITDQISKGYEYYLLSKDQTERGYLCLVPNTNERKMMISKIYIDHESRGSGLGNYLLHFVKEECEKRKFQTIWLTVNKYNTDTINWYKRKGFTTVKEVKADIGNGFYMDDYVMELKLNV